MPSFRVIVTGARDYKDRELVERTLRLLFDACQKTHRQLVVVHGACPTGADFFAHEWVRALPNPEGHEEAHPADFDKLGPSAGPRRNSEMARTGAHLCLAFCLGRTRGTIDMIGAAADFNIPFLSITRALPLAQILEAIVLAAG